MTDEQCEQYQNVVGMEAAAPLLRFQAMLEGNQSHRIAYEALNKMKRDGIIPGNMIILDSLHHVDEGDHE